MAGLSDVFQQLIESDPGLNFLSFFKIAFDIILTCTF